MTRNNMAKKKQDISDVMAIKALGEDLQKELKEMRRYEIKQLIAEVAAKIITFLIIVSILVWGINKVVDNAQQRDYCTLNNVTCE